LNLGGFRLAPLPENPQGFQFVLIQGNHRYVWNNHTFESGSQRKSVINSHYDNKQDDRALYIGSPRNANPKDCRERSYVEQ
jgi:hypothetical protein